ncbi:MAG: VWA domain-containing protein [Nannocystaceae bacterium]|nr:VWA domain-containing protein [Nannocystaceae bacterium]
MSCTRPLMTSLLLPLFAACSSQTPPDQGEGDSGSSGIMTTNPDTSASASTTGAGSGSTSSTGADGTDTELNCGEVDYQLQAVPPNVVLVLDKSGSMVSTNDSDGDGEMDGFWDHDADPMTPPISRWNSLHNVVEFVVNGFDAQINFGGVLFPSASATNQYSANACKVSTTPEIPVATMNAAAILDGIPDALATDEIQGATPATAGIQTALDHLDTLDPEVPQFLILVTDGAANCSADYPSPPELLENYDTNLPTLIGTAFTDRNIPTFVVGIDIVDELAGVGADGVPEANTFVELNTVAEAGGRPQAGDEKFFNTINEIELMDALSEIAGAVVSCVIPLEPPPDYPDYVEVQVGGVDIPRVDDCATEDGWVFSNPDGPYDSLELCGAACDQLVEIGTVDAKYGCPPAG